MRVHSATRAGGTNNQDRLFITDHAVILLDGASAFEPADVDAGTYAETLGSVIAEQLDQNPALPITEAVAAGIRHATQTFALIAGRSPSSTVSVLRARPRAVDLYTLGDSPIHYRARGANHLLTDDRLSTVAVPEREQYRRRLRAGHGFDVEHQAALVALQQAQRRARNRAGGYWIAETDPGAAQHGHTRAFPADAISWAVLATDGAADLIEHTGPSWTAIARYSPDELTTLLDRIHHWEATTDPAGTQLPRAKPHDDKTIVAITDIGSQKNERSTTRRT